MKCAAAKRRGSEDTSTRQRAASAIRRGYTRRRCICHQRDPGLLCLALQRVPQHLPELDPEARLQHRTGDGGARGGVPPDHAVRDRIRSTSWSGGAEAARSRRRSRLPESPRNPRARAFALAPEVQWRMRLLIPVLVSLALVAGCRGREATRPMADKSLSRTTTSGEVVGFVGPYGSATWLGIPYAAPPGGDL